MFMLAATLWAQTTLGTEWRAEGLRGIGLFSQSVDWDLFLWTDLRTSGAAGVAVGPVALGALRFSPLALGASGRSLPVPWDAAWTRGDGVALDRGARSAQEWAAYWEEGGLSLWGASSKDTVRAGAGVHGSGTVLDRWSLQGEGALHGETSSESWFERPVARQLGLRLQGRLGLGSLANGVDLLARVGKREFEPLTSLATVRVAWRPVKSLSGWGSASYDGGFQFRSRWEWDMGAWNARVQWEGGERVGRWEWVGTGRLGARVEFGDWGLHPSAELQLRAPTEARLLTLVAALSWWGWRAEAEARWELGVEPSLRRTQLRLVHDTGDLRLRVQASLVGESLTAEGTLGLNHPEVRAEAALPWEADKGPGAWSLTISRTFP